MLLRRALVAIVAATALISPRAAGAAGQQTPETIVGGHHYAFPADVFEGGVVETGKQSSFLIELAWPEMRGLTPAERGLWPPRKTIRILAVTGTAPGARADDAILGTSLAQGLEAAVGFKVGEHRPMTLSSRPPHGLAPDGARMVESQPQWRDSDPRDVFVADPVESPSEYIECNYIGKGIVHASCSQVFIFDGLHLKVSYEREIVGSWRAIHEALTIYLRDKEIKHEL